VERAGQIVPAVLFLSLLALILSDRQNWGVPPPPRVWTKLQVPSNRAFIGDLESTLVAQTDSYLPVNGWAAATSSAAHVARVELHLNQATIATVTDFGRRPDLAAAFGRPDFEWSGWHCNVSTKKLQPGEYELQLRVIGSDGNSQVVVSKKLTIVE